MIKQRPVSVTVVAILCMLAGLFFLFGCLLIDLRLLLNNTESITLIYGFLGLGIFCVGIGLFWGHKWARLLIMFFSIAIVVQSLFRFIILMKAWQYELYLLGENSPVSLEDVRLSIFSEFLPAFGFCIVILFIMNTSSVKSFFKPKE